MLNITFAEMNGKTIAITRSPGAIIPISFDVTGMADAIRANDPNADISEVIRHKLGSMYADASKPRSGGFNNELPSTPSATEIQNKMDSLIADDIGTMKQIAQRRQQRENAPNSPLEGLETTRTENSKLQTQYLDMLAKRKGPDFDRAAETQRLKELLDKRGFEAAQMENDGNSRAIEYADAVNEELKRLIKVENEQPKTSKEMSAALKQATDPKLATEFTSNFKPAINTLPDKDKSQGIT